MKIFSLIAILILFQDCYGQFSDSLKKKSLAFENLGWGFYQKSEFEKSIQYFDSSIAFDSTRYISYQLKAESLWFIKRYAEAANIYAQWIKRDSDVLMISAEVMDGMLYDKAHMRKKAKEHYWEAIHLYEDGYKPLKQFVEVEETEYVFAFGLLRNKKLWNKKINWLANRHHSNYEILKKKRRKELLDFHFEPFEYHKINDSKPPPK